MRDSIKTLIWYLSTTHELPSPVVELGSRQAPNQVGYADLRPFFTGKKYIGCDIDKGPGVDRIEDIENLKFKDNTIATALCLDTIEHVQHPVRALSEIFRCLNKDGILILTSHMWFPVHYDPDYWRFTPQCFKNILLYGYAIKEIYIQGQANFPHLIAGLACKNEKRPFHINLDELNSMLPCPYPFPFTRFKE